MEPYGASQGSLSDLDFQSKLMEALKLIRKEIVGVTLEGWERQFRHSLAQHLLFGVLGWCRESGKGHYVIGEIRDITIYDDENFPVAIIETKSPNVEFAADDKVKLANLLEEQGAVYGVLTNSRKFILYQFDRVITPTHLREITVIDMQYPQIVPVDKLLELRRLERERFVKIEDYEYFSKRHRAISITRELGVDRLNEKLRDIISDLTSALKKFFREYYERKDYTGQFLHEAFSDWLKFSNKEKDFNEGSKETRAELVEVFCRESAYVILGRILFTRTCEDKGILEYAKLSGIDLTDFLKRNRGIENSFLFSLKLAYKDIERYYSHLYELSIFDWWLVPEEKRALLSAEDFKVQRELEASLDQVVRRMLKKMNVFDFGRVDRDILGDVYQGYLPVQERKTLGEFYTPREVIEYILDNVGYMKENEIRGKLLLDLACGSGGFLVEAVRRLIDKYRSLGFDLSDAAIAKEVIQEVVHHIYGLDIHPFACFITEINLLFQLLDLYSSVRRRERDYALPRFNIYCTDSLAPEERVEDLPTFLNARRKWLVDEVLGATKVKKMSFHFIVGNPPYVRMEKIGERQRKLYKRIYFSAKVLRPDLYILFMEKAIRWLEESGQCGLIVQNKFLALDNGKLLRKFILDTCRIRQIVDVSNVKVFVESIPFPVIVILQKEEKEEAKFANKLQVAVVREDEPNVLRELRLGAE